MIYFNTLLNTALGTGPQIRKALYPEPSSIRKDQWWFFLCIFRTLPDLNFAATENWAFHISEGTVFTLSNLSFAYLHGFSHFISFCLYLYRGAERKITTGLYEGEVWKSWACRVICKVTLSLGLLSPHIPSFGGIRKVGKEILLNLSMTCWNSVFNAQGSRVIIVVVQVGEVKIYVATVEALRKKERQDETSLGPNSFVLQKISFPVRHFVAYYGQTGHSHALITGLYR